MAKFTISVVGFPEFTTVVIFIPYSFLISPANSSNFFSTALDAFSTFSKEILGSNTLNFSQCLVIICNKKTSPFVNWARNAPCLIANKDVSEKSVVIMILFVFN